MLRFPRLLKAIRSWFGSAPASLFILLAVALNIITWLWVSHTLPRLGQTAILHYSVVFGVDEVGEPHGLYFLSLTGLTIVVANWLIAKFLRLRDNFFQVMISVVSLFCQVVLLMALILIAHASR